MVNLLLYLILGAAAGVFGGLVGVGGGIIIIPALVYLFGMTQHHAQGTALATLVPPIGILAAYTYYKEGFVDVKVALFIALGFFAGSLVGARLATSLSNAMLQKVFGIVLLVVALRMIFSK